ncbi:MAG: Rpn family recombination-promoting nuclease/putative transposase [Hungatella hathewayi]|jgi:predicted transposase/invertase (TIGR01784 family)|uniref:Rpn family recombination-promoting nuclease/putative transposase n=1 Tax=Hungatella TaxID=1649459 RepID=UPI0011DD5C62|nr:Rpn family recombination-promoting nuclease/putative transposase [Hungatella hathewayi]MDU4971663.1 Rpn family recombination-promoting nuclease/putative transposase [Hungatella hathewayi]
MERHEKTLRELNLEDDFLFARVMSDKEICRKVLERILNISIKEVVLPTTQRTIDLLFEGKGIRLDVYVNDDKGTVYNCEMQRGRRRELPKRSRYYLGSIDLDLIAAGQPYTALRKTFIIFVCTFDPFKDGRHIYSFENICRENTAISLGDEAAKIFLNTKGTADDIDHDMKEFLTYIENTTDTFAAQTSSALVKEIHEKVTEVKQSKEMEVEYMTLLQRDREKQEEGALLATRIIRLHLKGMSGEEIALSVHVDQEYVNSIIADFEKE